MGEDRFDPAVRYRESVALLDRMMDSRERHLAKRPDCTAAPLCIGITEGVRLAMLLVDKPGTVASLVMAAVGELSRMRAELADVRNLGRHYAQDAVSCAEALGEARGQIDSLTAIVGDLQRELTEARSSAGRRA